MIGYLVFSSVQHFIFDVLFFGCLAKMLRNLSNSACQWTFDINALSYFTSAQGGAIWKGICRRRVANDSGKSRSEAPEASSLLVTVSLLFERCAQSADAPPCWLWV